VELHRLDQDPSEKTDLSGEEPDRASAMQSRLRAWYADTQKNATHQVGGWLKAGRHDGGEWENRIAFVEKLLPKGKPLHFAIGAKR
jgi:hypothetical protein